MNKRFLRSLYEEHLEEISALWERRRAYLDDFEVDADDVMGLEERMEAHLDALVVGGDAALKVCEEQASDGDVGELYAAICVFCRQGRHDLFEAALARVDEEQEDEEEASAEEGEPAEDEDEDDAQSVNDLDFVTKARAEKAARGEVDEDIAADGDGEEDEAEAEEPEPEPEDEDDDEPRPSEAVADALSQEGPAAWQAQYQRLLVEGSPPVRWAVATMIGHRGPKLGPQLVAAAQQPDLRHRVIPMLWALGRLRERSALGVLSHFAQKPDTPEAFPALLAMLRYGDPGVVEHVARLVGTHPWAALLLAISGGPAHGPLIQARLSRDQVHPDEMFAAGLFGDASAVTRLLECFEKGVHPEVAAQALYLLTGAPLFETVEVEAEEDEGVAALQNPEGSKDAPAEGEEPEHVFMVEVVRLSQEPLQWRQWWEEHVGSFARGKRYRLGQLASPEALGRTLHQFVVRQRVRQLAAEEVGLRYWPQRDLDVDMRAPAQHAALAGLPALRDTDATIGRGDGYWIYGRQLQR